ncbi:TauD/TfdA family dioxygenase [Verticiella sediminum]|uniref:TauD/TfdA family dioxygenase n=1 Tax=Verticiella sediminum TaxID=1247510 RepID=A0A556AVX1_9BURK|nr:TauD/TfdA family dioxygenase [Verticiella sediminum]TSH97098.1 TauD/TfdA family dioxygenase [Verticiella sediminum]
MHTAAPLAIRPLRSGFGAQILDVDLASADSETLQGVVQTFNLHGAILLRGQNMDPAALVSFASQFGEPEEHTVKKHTMAGFPEIYMLTNRKVDGKPVGSHNDGVGWHTDFSYKEEPVMCTMLYAVSVPEEGGDTLLADMCAAYAALPPDEQERLAAMTVHHSYQYFATTRKYNRRELTEAERAAHPDVFHPLIRTHPANGRKALWPSTGTVRGIVGMDPAEALPLIERLVEFGTQEQFVYRHRWQVGDILVWDNRCTLHTGTLFDDTRYVREMHRLWVKGDRPF